MWGWIPPGWLSIPRYLRCVRVFLGFPKKKSPGSWNSNPNDKHMVCDVRSCSPPGKKTSQKKTGRWMMKDWKPIILFKPHPFMGFLFQTFTKKGQKSHKPWNLLRKTTLPCDFEDSGVLKSSSFSNGKYPASWIHIMSSLSPAFVPLALGCVWNPKMFSKSTKTRTNLTTGQILVTCMHTFHKKTGISGVYTPENLHVTIWRCISS